MTLDDEAEDELRRIRFTYTQNFHLSLSPLFLTPLQVESSKPDDA